MSYELQKISVNIKHHSRLLDDYTNEVVSNVYRDSIE